MTQILLPAAPAGKGAPIEDEDVSSQAARLCESQRQGDHMNHPIWARGGGWMRTTQAPPKKAAVTVRKNERVQVSIMRSDVL